jgi:hypothetical protein
LVGILKMKKKVDEIKMKELSKILSLAIENHDLSKLLQFEKENNITYYAELLTTKSPMETYVLQIILERIRKIEFSDYDVLFVRKIADSILSFDEEDEHPYFLPQLFMVLDVYFSAHRNKTNLFLMLFQEFSTNFHVIDSLLGIVKFMEFDSNISRVYKEILQLASKHFLHVQSVEFSSIIVLDLVDREEDLKPFYPELRNILLKSSLSMNYLHILELMISEIPNQDLLEIFQKFEGIFDSKEKNREYFYDYFMDIFESNNIGFEAFSSVYSFVPLKLEYCWNASVHPLKSREMKKKKKMILILHP